MSLSGVSVWTWHPLKWDLLLLNVLMLPWHPLRSLTQDPIATKWDIWYDYHHNQGLDSPFSITREQQLKTDWFRHVLQTLVQLITVHVWRLWSVRLCYFLINISDVSAVFSYGPASLSPDKYSVSKYMRSDGRAPPLCWRSAVIALINYTCTFSGGCPATRVNNSHTETDDKSVCVFIW